MTLPLAVHYRLDLLSEAAEDVEATRAEIIGMLVAFADLDAERLEREILRYRKLTVGDVVPEEDEVQSAPAPDDVRVTSNVVSIRPRGPGRPARNQAG